MRNPLPYLWLVTLTFTASRFALPVVGRSTFTLLDFYKDAAHAFVGGLVGAYLFSLCQDRHIIADTIIEAGIGMNTEHLKTSLEKWHKRAALIRLHLFVMFWVPSLTELAVFLINGGWSR